MTGTAQRESHQRKTRFNLLRTISLVGSIAALVKELRLPRDERTWHGSLGGVVPYDLRRPTLDKARERMWAPDSRYLLSARVFGAGWTINFGRLYALGRRRLQNR